jgi:hypothetical protein
MSNIQLIIEERSASIGNFLVGRLLPFHNKRMVGPFCFIDHMGPAVMSEIENLDVGPHPHIGLSTLTYLFDGAINHKDSLGTEIEISPGQVNWMTAGRGIVHSERTPERFRNTTKFLHGLQIWIALPVDKEEIAPTFFHADASQIPSWNNDGLEFKLIAGETMGKISPVPVHSALYFIEIKSTKAREVNLKEHLFGESAIYILQGAIESDGETFGPKQILVAKDATLCIFKMLENTTLYIFGGEPFAEERFIYWNFVSSKRERIDQAVAQWEQQLFEKVPGESEFVPLPGPKLK